MPLYYEIKLYTIFLTQFCSGNKFYDQDVTRVFNSHDSGAKRLLSFIIYQYLLFIHISNTVNDIAVSSISMGKN